jgi:hypothetical protein
MNDISRNVQYWRRYFTRLCYGWSN